MNLIESVFQRLQEMSLSSKEVARKFHDISEKIIDHLIKYYYIEDEELRSHWTDEIYSFMNKVSKLKSSNKFPSQEFIMKNTYEVYEDVICDWQYFIRDDYGYEGNFQNETLLAFVETYFILLSGNLAKYGRVSRKDVESYLEFALETNPLNTASETN